jgi:hypothetical protein
MATSSIICAVVFSLNIILAIATKNFQSFAGWCCTLIWFIVAITN